MPRELRLSVTIPLPDGVFEEADVLAKARPIVIKLKDDATMLGGTVEFDIVTPKPRASKADEPAVVRREAA